MIYAYSFTCNRDLDLSLLMVSTFKKHCKTSGGITVYNTDHDKNLKDYGNGAGWPASMLKLNKLREIVYRYSPTEKDYILSVDSDVVFTSQDVFAYINEAGIIGIKHKPEYYTHFGQWSHMSGALIFIRGDIARKMAYLREDELNDIRFKHFKPYNITENEDVVLSYLAKYVGAEHKELPGGLTNGNFESDVKENTFQSFYHLNYCPTMFLGESVTGKWDIPKVLRSKNINL